MVCRKERKGVAAKKLTTEVIGLPDLGDSQGALGPTVIARAAISLDLAQCNSVGNVDQFI